MWGIAIPGVFSCVTAAFTICNSALNPILYAVLNKALNKLLRESYRGLVRKARFHHFTRLH